MGGIFAQFLMPSVCKRLTSRDQGTNELTLPLELYMRSGARASFKLTSAEALVDLEVMGAR